MSSTIFDFGYAARLGGWPHTPPHEVLATSMPVPIWTIWNAALIATLWMWRRLHVDAAFAGVYAVLPELRHHFEGVGACDSFSTNAHKVCSWCTDKHA